MLLVDSISVWASTWASIDKRQVDRHLVTVEVGVESFAGQRMQMDRIAFHQHRLERHDAHAVQRGSTIEQHRMIGDHRLQDVPNLLILAFQHLLGALDRVGMTQFLELADNERLIELQGDLLGQAAVMQLQPRADHDHAAGRIIDAFAQQILAETALLALDHVGERLERTIAAAQDRSLAAIVVEQGIDRLLQHPLFVADDDFRSVQVDQFPQAIVAIDDPAVEVVQIAGGEIAGIQQHQRSQVGWDHGNHVQHHPFGLVVAVPNRFDDLQSIDQVLPLLLGVGLRQLARGGRSDSCTRS